MSHQQPQEQVEPQQEPEIIQIDSESEPEPELVQVKSEPESELTQTESEPEPHDEPGPDAELPQTELELKQARRLAIRKEALNRARNYMLEPPHPTPQLLFKYWVELVLGFEELLAGEDQEILSILLLHTYTPENCEVIDGMIYIRY